MNSTKKEFYYNGKTGIALTRAFEKKLLAKYSVNIGSICHFACSFCYGPTVTSKQKVIQDILSQGYNIEDVSCYRYSDNVLECISRDLRKIKPDDTGYVFFCTTCDPCATLEHADITVQAIKLIMQGSNLQVRVLSKSTNITYVAKSLFEYKNRIVYSLSTGTTSSDISKAIEGGVSDISERVDALQWLQKKGFRTFGMICPVLPSEVDKIAQLLDQVRPEHCEGIWAEAINIRGKSLINTYSKLMAAGLHDQATELQRVMGDQTAWIEYSKRLFLGFQHELRNRGRVF